MSKAPDRSYFNPFLEGDSVGIRVSNLANPDLPASYHQHFKVQRVVSGGGFYGTVVVPEDKPYVIKTGLPDPFHYLLRTAAWGGEAFPPQVNKTAAELDHISAWLIHTAIPKATDKEFYVPNNYGVASFPETFGQLIEFIDFRTPRFDLPDDELAYFKNAQPKLRKIALKYGLEHAAQVHEDNPYGLPNLVWDNNRHCLTWLDDLPAIPHQKLFGVLEWGFQQDTRKHFYGPQFRLHPPTFNTIHTNDFRSALDSQRAKFTDQEYQQIQTNLDLYDQLKSNYDSQPKAQQEKLPLVKAVSEVAKKVIIDGPKKAAAKPFTEFWELGKTTFSTEAYQSKIMEPVADAAARKLITPQEKDRAQSAIESANNSLGERLLTRGLPLTFFGIGRLTEAAMAISVGQMIQEGTILSGGPIASIIEGVALYAAKWAISNSSSFGITMLTEKVTGRRLLPTAIAGALPLVGTPLAGVTLLGLESAASQHVLHHTIREQIDKVSDIFPDGGADSERSARWYQKYGQPIENRLLNLSNTALKTTIEQDTAEEISTPVTITKTNESPILGDTSPIEKSYDPFQQKAQWIEQRRIASDAEFLSTIDANIVPTRSAPGKLPANYNWLGILDPKQQAAALEREKNRRTN